MERLFSTIPQGKTLHLMVTRTGSNELAVTIDFAFGNKLPLLVEGTDDEVLRLCNEPDIENVAAEGFNALNITEAKERVKKEAEKAKEVKKAKQPEAAKPEVKASTGSLFDLDNENNEEE